MVNTKEIIFAALRERNLTLTKFARDRGLNELSMFFKASYRMSIPATQFFWLLEELEIDSKFYMKETGELLDVRSDHVDIREVLHAVMKSLGISMYEASRRCGYHEQLLTQKVQQRASIQAEQFLEAMDKLGVECRFFLRGTDIELKEEQTMEKVVGNSDNIRFSTDKSKLLASSFGTGEDRYGPDGKAFALYVDREGRYFVAEYNKDPNVPGRVRTVPIHAVRAILAMYGQKE